MFFIVVEGMRGPKRPLQTIEEARAAARYMQELRGTSRRIFILQCVETVQPQGGPNTLHLKKPPPVR